MAFHSLDLNDIPRADLYIVAAGKGSRIQLDVPKALIPILQEPCLTTTLRHSAGKFRSMFVITNVLRRHQWRSYFANLSENYPELAKRTVDVPIESGLGDGHATLRGLLEVEKTVDCLSQEIVVAWGDVFVPSPQIFDEILSKPRKGSGLLPAVEEGNPYVSLLVDEEMRCLAADFSKHGELHDSGFHDQSIFRFERVHLRNSLLALHQALWKNGRYISPGGELSLLYSFHHLYNSDAPAYVYETKYSTWSFNTIDEVAAIQRNIARGGRLEDG